MGNKNDKHQQENFSKSRHSGIRFGRALGGVGKGLKSKTSKENDNAKKVHANTDMIERMSNYDESDQYSSKEDKEKEIHINFLPHNIIKNPPLFPQTQNINTTNKGLSKDDLDKQSSEEIKVIETDTYQGKSVDKLECKIGFDEMNSEDIFLFDSCPHLFHKGCLEKHISEGVYNRKFPICCPECRSELAEDEIRSLGNRVLYEKYKKFKNLLLVEQNGDAMIQCPTPNCEYIYKRDEEKREEKFTCETGNETYCISCRALWHAGVSGADYAKAHPNQDKEFFDHIEKTDCKKCPRCKFWVERSEGGNHMTCRCGFEFGYKCGLGYKDGIEQGRCMDDSDDEYYDDDYYSSYYNATKLVENNEVMSEKNSRDIENIKDEEDDYYDDY